MKIRFWYWTDIGVPEGKDICDNLRVQQHTGIGTTAVVSRAPNYGERPVGYWLSHRLPGGDGVSSVAESYLSKRRGAATEVYWHAEQANSATS
jgi:hypothetical protein